VFEAARGHAAGGAVLHEDCDDRHDQQKRHQTFRIAGEIQFEHDVLPPFRELDGTARQKFVTKVQRGLSFVVDAAGAAT
jgi:hypothetical protein